MCVGIPMRIERCDDGMAECAGRGRRERLNTMLLGDLPPPVQIHTIFSGAVAANSTQPRARTRGCHPRDRKRRFMVPDHRKAPSDAQCSVILKFNRIR